MVGGLIALTCLAIDVGVAHPRSGGGVGEEVVDSQSPASVKRAVTVVPPREAWFIGVQMSTQVHEVSGE